VAMTGLNWRQDKVTDRPSPLREVLEAIQAQLVLRAGDPTSDKMLIVGHSMGGNMLAKMMLDIVPPKIKRHAPGQAMRPPVGDLVVLLNPASDAASWTTLQAAERARAGFAPRENAISCNNQPDCPERANIIRWRKLYPIQQRPVYISLTSASDWGTLKNAGRKVEFDTATSQIFPFARSLGGYGGERNLTAIGHLLPKFDKDNTLLGLPEGTSHEVVVLQGAVTPDGARYASTYGNAAHPARAWCAPAHGWLRAARAPDQPGYLPQQNWDYGYRANPPEGQTKYLKNLGGPLNEASIQWRQGLYTRANLNALSVSPGTTPFWNVRALDSAIRGHAGWASYPIWCALNQMVLDDITAPGPSQP
jgi:hypothetical protein